VTLIATAIVPCLLALVLSNGWFPPSRIRCHIRSRCRSRFRKNRARTCRICRCCWGVCAAIARQAHEAGRRVSCAKEWAQIQGGYERQVRKNRTRSYMNGWTATKNLRKRRTLFFYVSYGVLTEFLRINVILTYFATETATATGTLCWKPGISQLLQQEPRFYKFQLYTTHKSFSFSSISSLLPNCEPGAAAPRWCGTGLTFLLLGPYNWRVSLSFVMSRVIRLKK